MLQANSNGFRLDGKLAVVTGGGSGIGLAVAHTFSQHGSRVRVLDINWQSAETVAQEIVAAGGDAKAYLCDVAQQENVTAVLNGIFQEAPIDILVNNAGISHVGNLESTSEHDLDKLFCVNVKGMYNCMYAAISHMKANGGGV